MTMEITEKWTGFENDENTLDITEDQICIGTPNGSITLPRADLRTIIDMVAGFDAAAEAYRTR